MHKTILSSYADLYTENDETSRTISGVKKKPKDFKSNFLLILQNNLYLYQQRLFGKNQNFSKRLFTESGRVSRKLARVKNI